ncbi:MAG: TonB-dependent receptor [Bacteroidia bacterium]
MNQFISFYIFSIASINKSGATFFVLCLLLIPTLSLAQEVSISVLDDESGKPIKGAQIKLFDQNGLRLASCSTDAQAQCSFDAPIVAQAKIIKCGHLEYETISLKMADVAHAHFKIQLKHRSFDAEEIVMVANRRGELKSDIPHQIQVIKAQDIALKNPQTSADLLSQNGQVFVQKSQQGGGSPNLRGFEANKVLLVVDGIRMNNAIYRSGHLQNVVTLDPAMIDRTEIMFGPGSVIYGSDALGGVMHFYTRNPDLSSKAESEIKSQHFARYYHANRSQSLHSDINFGFEKWAALSSISLNRFGDLRVGRRAHPDYPEWGLRPNYIDPSNLDLLATNDGPHQMVPTGYAQIDFTQKVLFVPSDKFKHQLQFQYSNSTNINRFDRLTQLRDSSLRYAEWYYGPQERLMLSYHFSAYEPTKLYDQLDLITAWQDLDESRVNREVGANIRNHRLEDVKVGSFNLNLTKALANVHELAYGLDFAYNRVNSSAFSEVVSSGERLVLDTRYPDGGTDWLSAAVYFTHRWEISPKVILTEGLRFNQVSLYSQFVDTSFFSFPFNEIRQNNSALSGNLGVVFKLPHSFRFSAIGSTGFRAPNLDDVAKVFDSQPGNVVVPNPNLRAETTYNLEFSLSKNFGKYAMIELVAWHTWYQDAIVLRAASYNGQSEIIYQGILSQVQMNVNAGQARIVGASTNAWLKLADWTLSHSITYTYGQDLSNDVPLDHIPPLFGRAALQYANGPWQAELSVPYQGWKRLDRFSPRDEGDIDFATPEGWPSWMILTLRGTYSFDNGVQLQGGCENILDQHYRPFSSRISAAGRNLFVAVRASF